MVAIRLCCRPSMHVLHAALACILFLPPSKAAAMNYCGVLAGTSGSVASTTVCAICFTHGTCVHGDAGHGVSAVSGVLAHSQANDRLQSSSRSMDLGHRAAPGKGTPLLISCLVIGLVLPSALATLWLCRWRARERHRREQLRAKWELSIRESHDTLLQEIQGLVLRFEAVARHMSAEDPLRVMLDAVLERADRVVLDGRDRIRNMEVVADSDFELSTALAMFAEDLSSDGAPSFRLVVEGES